ncbi:MAG: 50S ribosomal protein L4 [Clostridia bacterium]|nr:50S ribosomal protein L4 [Clostridia bacterium]
MPKVKVYNTKAEVVGQTTLSDEVFGCEYNEALIHQVVVAYNNNQRQGTKSALLRSEVRGHAKKPWRQKGTGRARQGSTKSAQWKGGGIIFAPKPRDFSQKVNKTMKVAAFKSAISAKLADSEVVVLDAVTLVEPKTKLVQEILNNFKVDGKNVMFVLKEKDDTVLRASNNIPNLKVTYADVLGTYDIVANSKLYITKDAIKKLEEAYK